MSPEKLYQFSSSSLASSSIGSSIDTVITIVTIDITGQGTHEHLQTVSPTSIQTLSTYPNRRRLAHSFHLTRNVPLLGHTSPSPSHASHAVSTSPTTYAATIHNNNPLPTRSSASPFDVPYNPLATRPSTPPTMYLSATYTYLSIRHTPSKCFQQPASRSPKLSELVPTLTSESNFASWPTALKYALDTRNPANTNTNTNANTAKSANAVNNPALTSTPETTYAITSSTVRYNHLFNN